MSHFIVPDGPFAKAFAALAATGWRLNLESTIVAGQPKAPPSKLKFTCSICGANAWGRPDSQLICGICLPGAFDGFGIPDMILSEEGAERLIEAIGRTRMLAASQVNSADTEATQA